MAPRSPSHRAAQALGLLSVLTYNWWVGAVLTGVLTSPDGMFSDLEADGVPHALVFERLDIASGLLMCAGLLLLGAPVAADRLREWRLMVGFGAAGVIGGMFPYACPEGKDDACRSAEWSFQLPLHHYVHMAAGIVEFGCATLAIILIWRRLHSSVADVWATSSSALAVGLAIGYPALAGSYLLDMWDAPVEAFFFVLFAGVAALVFIEPAQRREHVHPRTPRARSTSSAIATRRSSTESKRTMPRNRSANDTSTWRP